MANRTKYALESSLEKLLLKKPLVRVVKGTVVEKLLRDHGILKDSMM